MVPSLMYVRAFGTDLATSHTRWGEFGDFIGGVLNPLYALLAFLAVLYTVSIQAAALKQAQEDFEARQRKAQEQIDHLKEASYKEDILRIIKDINEKLEGALQVEVSADADAYPKLHLYHMIPESWRQQTESSKTGAYGEFVRLAQTRGTHIEAHFSELKAGLYNLHHYLQLYSAPTTTTTIVSPVIEYVARKYAGLVQILKDVGGVEPKVVEFFSNYTDKSALNNSLNASQH